MPDQRDEQERKQHAGRGANEQGTVSELIDHQAEQWRRRDRRKRRDEIIQSRPRADAALAADRYHKRVRVDVNDAQQIPPSASNTRSSRTVSTNGTAANTANSPITPARIVFLLPNRLPSQPLGIANNTKNKEKNVSENAASFSVNPM